MILVISLLSISGLHLRCGGRFCFNFSHSSGAWFLASSRELVLTASTSGAHIHLSALAPGPLSKPGQPVSEEAVDTHEDNPQLTGEEAGGQMFQALVFWVGHSDRSLSASQDAPAESVGETDIFILTWLPCFPF